MWNAAGMRLGEEMPLQHVGYDNATWQDHSDDFRSSSASCCIANYQVCCPPSISCKLQAFSACGMERGI